MKSYSQQCQFYLVYFKPIAQLIAQNLGVRYLLDMSFDSPHVSENIREFVRLVKRIKKKTKEIFN